MTLLQKIEIIFSKDSTQKENNKWKCCIINRSNERRSPVAKEIIIMDGELMDTNASNNNLIDIPNPSPEDIEKAKDGDLDAYWEIYKATYEKAQEVMFVRHFYGNEKYEERAYEIVDDVYDYENFLKKLQTFKQGNFGGWFSIVLKNAKNDFFRKYFKKEEYEDENGNIVKNYISRLDIVSYDLDNKDGEPNDSFLNHFSSDPMKSDPATLTKKILNKEWIDQCISKMPYLQAETIRRQTYDFKTGKEIAEELGITEDYVRRLTYEARKHLKAKLNDSPVDKSVIYYETTLNTSEPEFELPPLSGQNQLLDLFRENPEPLLVWYLDEEGTPESKALAIKKAKEIIGSTSKSTFYKNAPHASEIEANYINVMNHLKRMNQHITELEDIIKKQSIEIEHNNKLIKEQREEIETNTKYLDEHNTSIYDIEQRIAELDKYIDTQEGRIDEIEYRIDKLKK